MTTSDQETAVIRVNPYIDQDVCNLRDQAINIRSNSERTVITDDEDIKIATNDLSIISKVKKAIETKRKEYTGPINEHLKFINDAFKIVTEPLNQADKILRKKVLDYRAEQQRKAREIEEINQMRIEAAQREARLNGTGEISESIEILPSAPEPVKTVHADVGTLGTKQNWKCEVIDFAALPDEYKIVDQVKLNKVVRAGARSIPGVRIWSEDSIRVSSR